MVELKNIATDAENKRLLRLTEIMSNYLTLSASPKKLEATLQQFFTEKAKYEETITNQNLTIQSLQTKVQTMPKLEKTIKSLQDHLATLQSQTDGLKDTLNRLPEAQTLKDLNIKLQGESKAKDKKLNELTDELKSIESNYNNFLKEMESFNELKSELTQLKNQMATEVNQNQELHKTLLNERNTIQTLQLEKKGLENALHRLERRLIAKGYLRGLSIPVQHLEISEDLKGKADAEIQEQIKNMNFELQKRLDRIKELEMRINELKERLAKSSTHDLQVEIQTLKSDLEARKGTIMGYESNQKKLMEQIDSLQKRTVELQNKLMAQGKEIDEKNTMVKNLETAVSSGVHDQQAREVIQNLQNQNRDLRNEVRENEKIIRSLEKNTKFLQTEMKNQKDQSYKLYTQSKDQLTLIQKLQTALRQGGASTAGLDLKDLRNAPSALGDEGTSLDSEIKERDRKIARLESYSASIKQQIEDLQFQITSRDVKVDELTTIIRELKENIANSKAKIIVRPPSSDEYRKTKIKI